MKLVKVRRKWAWVTEPPEQGWVFNKLFPTKWKAEIAKNVALKGGKPRDCWKKYEAYSSSHPQKEPCKVLKIVRKQLEEIQKLNPTPAEIEKYAEDGGGGYGTVTVTDSTGYFPPKLHNTWGKKWGGRVHIDMGSGGYHLMLDKHAANNFIEYLKDSRKS